VTDKTELENLIITFIDTSDRKGTKRLEKRDDTRETLMRIGAASGDTFGAGLATTCSLE